MQKQQKQYFLIVSKLDEELMMNGWGWSNWIYFPNFILMVRLFITTIWIKNNLITNIILTIIHTPNKFFIGCCLNNLSSKFILYHKGLRTSSILAKLLHKFVVVLICCVFAASKINKSWNPSVWMRNYPFLGIFILKILEPKTSILVSPNTEKLFFPKDDFVFAWNTLSWYFYLLHYLL